MGYPLHIQPSLSGMWGKGSVGTSVRWALQIEPDIMCQASLPSHNMQHSHHRWVHMLPGVWARANATQILPTVLKQCLTHYQQSAAHLRQAELTATKNCRQPGSFSKKNDPRRASWQLPGTQTVPLARRGWRAWARKGGGKERKLREFERVE